MTKFQASTIFRSELMGSQVHVDLVIYLDNDRAVCFSLLWSVLQPTIKMHIIHTVRAVYSHQ